MLSSDRDHAFARLRTHLPPTVKTTAVPGLRSSGMPALDKALGGGLVAGSVVTIEGALGSGGSGLLARLLATITQDALAGVCEQPKSVAGRFDPATLAFAGVRLERLFFIHADEATHIAQASDILIRSGMFALLAVPVVEMRAQVWTRLAQLAHRHACLLIAIGEHAPSELRFCATMRLRCSLSHAQWNGVPGIFSSLEGMYIDVEVAKNKIAAPQGRARIYYRHQDRSP